MKQKSVASTIFLLAPFVFSFAFAMDIYIPAIPKMKEVLHTSQENIQLTLSLFMFMTGLGQLVIGPISDQFGRRSIALLSVAFFILGSGLCASANSIHLLIFARIFQAFGGCGMLVVSFAAVRDQFSGNELAKVYSFLNCGIGMSPLFAPIIGSYLYHWFDWRAGFIFLTVMGVIIFITSFFNMKETLPAEKRVKINAGVFLRYWKVLKNATFISYAFTATAGLITFFVFFSSSPYIIINLLHAPVKYFGYYFFTVGAMFFVGSLICGKLAHRIGPFKSVIAGSFLLLLAGLIMLVWYWVSGISTAQYLLPCMMAGIGGAFMMGAGAGGAMEPFGEAAGLAAALVGCLEFLCAAIFGTIVMQWPVTSTIPLSLTMLGLSALALLVMISYRYFQTKAFTNPSAAAIR
ncbi:MAG: multidrug effflux MFS transporter [Gammaproteobacteria bacterium]|nr:multidrug effflux MFS transporter [Gammaproteobacteria bacterium]